MKLRNFFLLVNTIVGETGCLEPAFKQNNNDDDDDDDNCSTKMTNL